jgi:hypothetical protein
MSERWLAMRVQSWVSYLVQHANAAEAPPRQHQDEECQEAYQTPLSSL